MVLLYHFIRRRETFIGLSYRQLLYPSTHPAESHRQNQTSTGTNRPIFTTCLSHAIERGRRLSVKHGSQPNLLASKQPHRPSLLSQKPFNRLEQLDT